MQQADQELNYKLSAEPVNLQEVRSRLVNQGILYLSILAPLGVIISLFRVFEHGWHFIYVIHISLLFAALSVFFLKRLSYATRAGILLGVVFLIGVSGVFAYGLVGGGLLVLAIFPLLAAVMFGHQGGLVACLTSLVVLAIAGAAICLKLVTFHFDIADYATSVTGWIGISLPFIMWVPATVIALGIVHEHLSKSISSLQRFALVIEQATESVVITDTTGRITYVNPAFERTTGYRFSEVAGQNPRILKSGKIDPAVYRDLWATISQGSTWSGQLTNKTKNKELFTEECSITPLRSESGEVISYVAVKRNITHELELQAQFFQAQKMEAIGKLAGGVAHDLNNMLQVILGYSQMVLEESRDQETTQSLEEILSAAERATTLVGQLLAFSRKQVLKPVNLDLSETVGELARMIRRLIGEHIALSTNLGSGQHLIHADKGQIEQVLMNLCVNARDAMQNGGMLSITVDRTELDAAFCETHAGAQPGDVVVISVADTGHGMDEQTVERAFEPFFTTKESGQGTGLGLSTVFGIVRQHNGIIEVNSEVDRGTTVNIYFPRIEGGQAEELPEIKPGPVSGTGTVLLADDDEAVRNTTAALLSKAGYTIIAAHDGHDAIRLYNEHQTGIDIAVLDVVMPNLGGREVLEYIRQHDPRLPVLFISGYPASTFKDGLHLGRGVQLVQKPVTRETLLEKLQELLAEVNNQSS